MGPGRDRGAAGAVEPVALVALVALIAGGVQTLGLPGWLSCAVGQGVSSATGGPGSAGRCAGGAAEAGSPGVGHEPGERFSARTFRSGPAVLQGVRCTDSTYTRTCIEGGVLQHCSARGCPDPGRVPLAAFSRCAAAPVTTRDEGAPARLLCALEVPDRDEPHLVECVSDTGGVWAGGAAAGCTDTTDSAVDPGAGANLVADCRVVSFDALQDEQVHVDVRWACVDWAGRAYACTGSVEIPLGAGPDPAVDVRAVAGRRAQSCATRTFDTDELSCSPVGAGGEVACQVGDEMTLTCAVLSADEREIAASSTWGRPTNCVRADHRSAPQAALERCTEVIGTSTPSPGQGRGDPRGLKGVFDPAPSGSDLDDTAYLDGLIDEELEGLDDDAPVQEPPATTVRPPSLATACAAAAGDVLHGVWSPGGNAFVTSPLAVEHVEHPVAGTPADQMSPLANHVGQLQQIVSTLAGPSPATGTTIPPPSRRSSPPTRRTSTRCPREEAWVRRSSSSTASPTRRTPRSWRTSTGAPQRRPAAQRRPGSPQPRRHRRQAPAPAAGRDGGGPAGAPRVQRLPRGDGRRRPAGHGRDRGRGGSQHQGVGRRRASGHLQRDHPAPAPRA